MDIDRLAQVTARRLGESLMTMQERGDSLRSERRTGWLATESWAVAPDAPLPSLIDHTILKPEATGSDVERLCAEAVHHNFRAVCVNPAYVRTAAHVLREAEVRVAAVVGFPLGASRSLVKAIEAMDCIAQGAKEVDMVIHVGALKEGRWSEAFSDVGAVVDAVGGSALVKVILETALLTEEEKVIGSLLCQWAGADYVKTSTGFGPAGATVADVSLLRRVVGDRLGVKAAGGIKDAATARAMVVAGASRIGTSRGLAIAVDRTDRVIRNEG